MKITKAQLKQIIKEEMLNEFDWEKLRDAPWLGVNPFNFNWFGDDEEEELDPAGQSEAVPAQTTPSAPGPEDGLWWAAFPGKTPARRRAPPALHPGDRTGGISTSDGRSAISDEEEPWETTTVASGDIGEWKPGMPKPKLPKNWRTLPYKDPRRAAYRDWYKYIKSKRKARERRKALAKLSRDAATLPLSDQSRAKMGDPSAGPWPNVRVPPVDPYDPIIGNRRLAPRYENKITIDSIKELIQEVLSNK